MDSKVAGSLINIAVHPHHGSKTYSSLIKELYSLDTAVRVRGDRYAWMVQLWENEDGRGRITFSGLIATFTRINMDGAWINMKTKESVDPDRLDQVREAVKDVQPNYHEFRFFFDPKTHQVVVETSDGDREFSPQLAEKFFSELCEMPGIVERFGEAEVHFVADSEALNRIITSKYLRSIRIRVTRPNHDSLADIERELLESMDSQNAREYNIELKAVRSQTLELDDRTKNLARIARKNGYVEGNVGGEKYSTKEHPMVRTFEFDTDAQTREAAFNVLAKQVLDAEGGNGAGG